MGPRLIFQSTQISIVVKCKSPVLGAHVSRRRAPLCPLCAPGAQEEAALFFLPELRSSCGCCCCCCWTSKNSFEPVLSPATHLYNTGAQGLLFMWSALLHTRIGSERAALMDEVFFLLFLFFLTLFVVILPGRIQTEEPSLLHGNFLFYGQLCGVLQLFL